jgi:ankyrin repeat protein
MKKMFLFSIVSVLLFSMISTSLAGELENDLIMSAMHGDLNNVRTLIKKGTNIEAKDKSGFTALMRAAFNGRTEVVKLLLDKGANIEARRDKVGDTPLMMAASECKTDTVRLLIGRGATVNTKDSEGTPAIVWAAGCIDAVRFMLDKGADVDAITNMNKTALMSAALFDSSIDVVRLLLDRGANINAKDMYNMTALMAASRSGNADTVKLLLNKGADITVRDSWNKTALGQCKGMKADEIKTSGDFNIPVNTKMIERYDKVINILTEAGGKE